MFSYSAPRSFSAETFSQAFYLSPKRAKTLINALECSEIPWPLHPFGRDLVKNLLEHYGQIFDIQTTAVITCILGQHYGKRHLSQPRDHLTKGIGFVYPPSGIGTLEQQLKLSPQAPPSVSNIVGSGIGGKSPEQLSLFGTNRLSNSVQNVFFNLKLIISYTEYQRLPSPGTQLPLFRHVSLFSHGKNINRYFNRAFGD